jgi:hypothetical protein
MSTPISAMIVSAARLPTPVTVSSRSLARANGAITSSTRRRDRLGGLVHEYYKPQHDAQVSEPTACLRLVRASTGRLLLGRTTDCGCSP